MTCHITLTLRRVKTRNIVCQETCLNTLLVMDIMIGYDIWHYIYDTIVSLVLQGQESIITRASVFYT